MLALSKEYGAGLALANVTPLVGRFSTTSPVQGEPVPAVQVIWYLSVFPDTGWAG